MSPTWTRNLPDKEEMHSLPIRRTPTSTPLRAIITSDDLIGTFTHFFHGRTVPCERPDCEACNAGMPYRYHAYVACFNPYHCLHFIFEMTAQVAEVLVKYRTDNLSLRGCQIEASRWGKRPNGRVILKTSKAEMPITELPAEPNMIRCLSTLWNLPLEQPDTAAPLKRSPRVNPKRDDLADGNGSLPLDKVSTRS